MSQTISTTYTDTGEKPLIQLPEKESGINLVTIKAGATDVWDLQVQMSPTSQRVTIPAYKTKSGDSTARVPKDVYAIGMTISTNASGAIILDIESI